MEVQSIGKKYIIDLFSMSEGEFRKILEDINTERIRMAVFDLYEVPKDY